MKLSQKADYALRAMFVLAQLSGGGKSVRTADLARFERIPEKFLELILVELRKAGLIKSQRGPEGGHRLARDPAQINVGEIWRAIDGPLSPVAGMDTGSGDGKSVALTCLAPVWSDVERAIAGVVDGVSLADLCLRAQAGSVQDYSI